MEILKLEGMMVFDSGKQNILDYAIHNTSQHLEIVFSPKNLTADDYILELLSFSLPSATTILVTSDKSLSNQAKMLKIKTLSISDFLSFLRKKDIARERAGETKLQYESNSQMQRLQEIFEERYKQL